MMMIMAMVVMMVSSVSARNMSNRPNCGKQPVCTCCKHRDCRHDKCQPKPASVFEGKAPQSPTFDKVTTEPNRRHANKSSQGSFGNMKR